MKKLIEPRTLKEFRSTGLLFFINQVLHAFGWVLIKYEVDDMEVLVPARTKYRGFEGKVIEEGYMKINKYMMENAEEIYKDCVSGEDESDDDEREDNEEDDEYNIGDDYEE